MTTCPSCGERAFSAWRKLDLQWGRLRACDHCGASLGLSSSVVVALIPWIGTLYLAGRARSTWGGLAWIAAGGILSAAITFAWIPLWQVVSAQTRHAELTRRARSGMGSGNL